MSACTASGRARPPCLVPCSRPVGGRGAWRTQLGSRSVEEGGTGPAGRVGPWLQGGLGPLGCPAETETPTGKQRSTHRDWLCVFTHRLRLSGFVNTDAIISPLMIVSI